MEYATENEMIDHCENYPCSECPIAYKCSMFGRLFGYLPKAPDQGTLVEVFNGITKRPLTRPEVIEVNTNPTPGL